MPGLWLHELMSPHFYLGTHRAYWLWDPAVDFPLFISHGALRGYKTLKPSTHGWALDSRGFTELSLHGSWTITPREYVEATARYDREIGQLNWAAPQDHMCEPWILAKTGLDVGTHLRATVHNFLELCALWPEYSDEECPYMPVIQGWEPDDYLACIDMYYAAGIRLEQYPVVGLGSICRRGHTQPIIDLVEMLTPRFAIHGFGVKTKALVKVGYRFESADSQAWSFSGRKNPPLPGHQHRNCGNCFEYARLWRDRLLARVDEAAAAVDPGQMEQYHDDWSAACNAAAAS
jgi:hypothetical protein